MAATYVKGNLLHLFIKDGAAFKAFAYAQSHELSFSVETTDISSKDHGIFPDKEVTGSSWSMSGEYYFTTETATKFIAMAKKTDPIIVAFAQHSDTKNETAAAGLKDVTNTGDTEAWEVGSWVQYGKALITSFSVSAGVGETATISIELTGLGALDESEPTA